MKYSKTCSCCGHVSAAYPRAINKPLASALKGLVMFYNRTGHRAKLKDLHLGNSQHSNFNWLAYFDLAHRNTEGWLPTRNGMAFLKDQITIPSFILIMDGEIVPRVNQEVWSKFGEPTQLTIHDLDEHHKDEDYWKEYKRMTLFD